MNEKKIGNRRGDEKMIENKAKLTPGNLKKYEKQFESPGRRS
jgi:hypothetical protein